MAAADVLNMKPPVSLVGNIEGELIILNVVAACEYLKTGARLTANEVECRSFSGALFIFADALAPLFPAVCAFPAT